MGVERFVFTELKTSQFTKIQHIISRLNYHVSYIVIIWRISGWCMGGGGRHKLLIQQKPTTLLLPRASPIPRFSKAYVPFETNSKIKLPFSWRLVVIKQNGYHCPGVGVGEFELCVWRQSHKKHDGRCYCSKRTFSLILYVCAELQNRNMFCDDVCKYTEQKYKGPVNNVARRRQVSSLELAGHPSVLCRQTCLWFASCGFSPHQADCLPTFEGILCLPRLTLAWWKETLLYQRLISGQDSLWMLFSLNQQPSGRRASYHTG